MSGRHFSTYGKPPTARRRNVIVFALILALGVGATGAALAWGSHDGSAAASGCGCASTVTLKVVATPAIAGSIRRLAAAFDREHHRAHARCTDVAVSSQADAISEKTLVDPSAGGINLWIPDSTLWAQRLATDLSQSPVPTASVRTHPSIASSPVVLAVPPSRVAQLASLDNAGLARAAAGAALPITVLDPLTYSDGLLSLLTICSVVPAAPTSSAGISAPSRALVALMARLSHRTYATPALGFDDLAHARTSIFASSEQAVIAHNRAAGRPIAAAVYSSGGSYSLDFPVVSLSRTNDDPAVTSVAAQFERRLRAIISHDTFVAAGFRDPAGQAFMDSGLGSRTVTPLGQPSAETAANLLRLWSATKAASHSLAVMDVSGSMSEQAGNGHSKIELAAAAAAAAVNFLPDDSSFGLWSFSSSQDGGSPWTALAPVAPLGSKHSGISQRRRLIAAATGLPARVHGATALYDTTLAAFQQIRNSYDPSEINSVVVLTDGHNDYPGGISLDTLLTQLRSLVAASRSVPILTIGIGTGADLPTLRRISAVTGGKTYAVKDPTQIGDVFLDAMLQRECRPTC